MKRSITLLFLAILYQFTLGQKALTVTLPTLTASPGQDVVIPVKLTGAGSSGTPISSANIKFTFDTTYLTFDTIQNFYSGMPSTQWFYSGNNNTGIIAANWLEPNLLTVAVPDGSTLYEVRFTYKGGGNSPLIFTIYEFTDATLNLIPTTPVNGAVNAITYNAVFKVDMSNQTVSPNGVHIAGSFNGWNYAATPMTAIGNGIYSATLALPELSTVNYRFVNGNAQSWSETVPASCGEPDPSGGYYRQVLIPSHDSAYPSVCFSRCGECPDSISVTFRVNMQNVTVSPSGVHIAGDFNGWNYSQIAMSNTSGSVYETTFKLLEASYYEYRFVNGNTASGAETVPVECSVNGNRYLTIPSQDTTLGVVCLDSCFDCGTVLIYSNVTFRVDMQTQEISPNGVHIAGTFQGWNPGTTLMTDAGNDIYTYTESLLANTSILYKFANGNDETGYEIVPFSCSSNGDRFFTVPETDTVIHLVCFGECDTCNTSGMNRQSGPPVLLSKNSPNPFSGQTIICYDVPKEGYLRLQVFNSFGFPVRTLLSGKALPGSYSIPFDRNDLPSGIYFCTMYFTSGQESQRDMIKMIVE